MNYTDLTTNIADICENTFTAAELAMFTQQAEQKIYNTVQFPDLRKVGTPIAMVSGTATITLPTDFLFPYSVAVISGGTDYIYLLQKDTNFIQAAYPTPATTGVPKHYALQNATTLLLGPTPNSTDNISIEYGYYPESIVTATNTWLGDTFDSALLNGALVEALRFMKGEEDMVAVYDKLYLQSIGLLKQLGDGKLRQDTYRSGQVRDRVG